MAKHELEDSSLGEGQASLKRGRYLLLTRLRLRLGAIFPLLCLILSRFELPLFIVGLVFLFLGVSLRLSSSGFILKDGELSVGGPYAFCRNPLYLGTILIQVGFGFLAGSISLAIIGFIIFVYVYLLVIALEEKWLLARFGSAYEEFLRSSPRLFPTPKSFPKILSLAGFKWERFFQNRELKNATVVVLALALFLLKYILKLWEMPLNLW